MTRAIVFILIGWVLMTRVLYPFNLAEIPGGRQMIDEQIAGLGPVGQGERMVMIETAYRSISVNSTMMLPRLTMSPTISGDVVIVATSSLA